MTDKFARNDKDGALVAFQSVWTLLTVIVTSVVIISCITSELGKTWLVQHCRTTAAIVDTFAIMSLYSLGVVESSIISVGFQSTRRYAIGTFFLDLLIPVEGVAVALVSLSGEGFREAAVCLVGIRTVGLVCYYTLLRHYEPWLKVGASHLSLSEIRRLLHPALASLGLTFSNALSLQGVLLAIGLVFSPAAAAIFATARLITRTPLQFIGLFNRATLPEMITAYARRNRETSNRLAILNLGVTAAVAVPCAVVFGLFGPTAAKLLSHGRIDASKALLFWLGFTAASQGTWNSIGQFLFAINKQHRFSYHYLVITLVVAVAPLGVARCGGSIEWIAAIWCVGETAMIGIVYWAWQGEENLRLNLAELT